MQPHRLLPQLLRQSMSKHLTVPELGQNPPAVKRWYEFKFGVGAAAVRVQTRVMAHLAAAVAGTTKPRCLFRIWRHPLQQPLAVVVQGQQALP